MKILSNKEWTHLQWEIRELRDNISSLRAQWERDRWVYYTEQGVSEYKRDLPRFTIKDMMHQFMERFGVKIIKQSPLTYVEWPEEKER